MIVERDKMHAPRRDVRQRRVQRIEVVRLPPQMHAHVAGPASRLERIQQIPPRIEAAQSGLPRQRHAMERRGDAVGQKLRLGIVQRDIGGKPDAGARLQLPLERVAVNIDDARKYQKPARIEPRAMPVAVDAGDAPVLDREVHQLLAVGTQQDTPAGDAQPFHRFLSQGSKTI